MIRSTTTRQLLIASLAVAVAGTAVVTTGIANAAPGATATVAPKVVQASTTPVVTVTGTGFRKANGRPDVGSAAASKVVPATKACSTSATGTPSALSVTSGTQLVVTLPSLAAGRYKLCIPFAASATTFVSAVFEVADLVAAANSDRAVYPLTGSVTGGQLVILTSTDATSFQPSATVVIGGVASPKVVVAGDRKSLTAVVPPHIATNPKASKGDLDEPPAVVLRTPGFEDVTFAAAGSTGYNYVSTVKVSPSVADSGDVVTITGERFTSASTVHFSNDGGLTSTEVCASQQVISASAIACTLKAAAVLPQGAYTVVVGPAVFDAANSTRISSHATLTVADF